MANRMRKMREAQGLNQNDVGKLVGVEQSAVSKWERGDSIPDVIVLSELAELFSVTVDYFLHIHTEDEKPISRDFEKRRTHLAISLTACLAPYVFALILFFIMGEILGSYFGLWRIFIIATAAASVIMLIFSSLFAKNRTILFIAVSILLWSAIFSVYAFIYALASSWLVFVIGAPLEIIILVWLFALRKKK